MPLGLACTAGRGLHRNARGWAPWGLPVTKADGRRTWECYSPERYAQAGHHSQSLRTHCEHRFPQNMQVLYRESWNGDFSEVTLESMDLTSGQQRRVQVKTALRLEVQVRGSLSSPAPLNRYWALQVPFPSQRNAIVMLSVS